MKNSRITVSCSLTSSHLRERKQIVITSLKEKVLNRKELLNGYAYQFKGTDKYWMNYCFLLRPKGSVVHFMILPSHSTMKALYGWN